MQHWHNECQLDSTNPLIEEIFTNRAAIFDIETTGLSPAKSQLYMIGCAARRQVSDASAGMDAADACDIMVDGGCSTSDCTDYTPDGMDAVDSHGVFSDSGLTMSGCNDDMFYVDQFFAESPDEEAAVLSAFLEHIDGCDTLITYNGGGFDIPYLAAKCAQYGIASPFDKYAHLDIFKEVIKVRHLLAIPNCRLKTVEQFLGICREDEMGGGELIDVYQDYVNSPSAEALSLLRLHNYEDVADMPGLLAVLAYGKIAEGGYKIASVTENAYKPYNAYNGDDCLEGSKPCSANLSSTADAIDAMPTKQVANFARNNSHFEFPAIRDNSSPSVGETAHNTPTLSHDKMPSPTEAHEIILTLENDYPAPRRVTCAEDDVFLCIDQARTFLRVRVTEGELKYFFQNYKDYYYLPFEDAAIHKSVAAYVDPSRRKQATAATCYAKKTAAFLPQYEPIFAPAFLKEYSRNPKVSYFELTEEFLQEVQLQTAPCQAASSEIPIIPNDGIMASTASDYPLQVTNASAEQAGTFINKDNVVSHTPHDETCATRNILYKYSSVPTTDDAVHESKMSSSNYNTKKTPSPDLPGESDSNNNPMRLYVDHLLSYALSKKNERPRVNPSSR